MTITLSDHDVRRFKYWKALVEAPNRPDPGPGHRLLNTSEAFNQLNYQKEVHDWRLLWLDPGVEVWDPFGKRWTTDPSGILTPDRQIIPWHFRSKLQPDDLSKFRDLVLGETEREQVTDEWDLGFVPSEEQLREIEQFKP